MQQFRQAGAAQRADQGVDPAHLCRGLGDHPLDLGRVGAVGLEETGLGAERVGGSGTALGVAPDDADGGASFGKGMGAGEADPRGAAGDQDGLVGDFHVRLRCRGGLQDHILERLGVVGDRLEPVRRDNDAVADLGAEARRADRAVDRQHHAGL